MPQAQAQTTAFLGLNTRTSPASMAWQEGLADNAMNRRLDMSGMFRRRPGFSRYGSLPQTTAGSKILNGWQFHCDSQNKDYLIIHCADQKLYSAQLPNDNTFAPIANATAASATEAGTGFVYNDQFYYYDTGIAYQWKGTGIANTPGLAAPVAAAIPAEDALVSSRMRKGRRWYIQTAWDATRNVESLPSPVPAAVTELATSFDRKVTITNAGAAKNRYYRTLRTDDSRNIYNSESLFYFVGEDDTTGYIDFRNDEEIMHQRLNCRGGQPKKCKYAMMHRGRAFYGFYTTAPGGKTDIALDRLIEWSSAGRPEEVAREYSITYGAEIIEQMPELVPGLFMESRIWVPENVGGTLTGLASWGRNLFWFTQHAAGILEGEIEPFRQLVLSHQVGACAHRTLQTCGDWGFFGASQNGVWRWRGEGFEELGRLEIDITDSAKCTALNPAQLSNSFGLWVPELQEYWWIAAAAGSTDRTRAIVYQVDRGIFTGPYDFELGVGIEFTGGLTVVLDDVDPVTILFTSDGYVVKLDDTVMTDYNATAANDFTTTARYWFGGNSPMSVKKDHLFEICYNSITPDKKVRHVARAGKFAIAGHLQYDTHHELQSTDEQYPIARVPLVESGRYAMLEIREPAGCDAPITSITWKREEVPWDEKGVR